MYVWSEVFAYNFMYMYLPRRKRYYYSFQTLRFTVICGTLSYTVDSNHLKIIMSFLFVYNVYKEYWLETGKQVTQFTFYHTPNCIIQPSSPCETYWRKIYDGLVA